VLAQNVHYLVLAARGLNLIPILYVVYHTLCAPHAPLQRRLGRGVVDCGSWGRRQCLSNLCCLHLPCSWRRRQLLNSLHRLGLWATGCDRLPPGGSWSVDGCLGWPGRQSHFGRHRVAHAVLLCLGTATLVVGDLILGCQRLDLWYLSVASRTLCVVENVPCIVHTCHGGVRFSFPKNARKL
jgi:hypothetical protein